MKKTLYEIHDRSIKRNVSGTVALIVLLMWGALFLVSPDAYSQTKAPATARETSLNALKTEILSFFEPLHGKIVSVSGNSVKADIGSQKSVRAGMRFSAFSEGVSFIHPVTREPLGRIEIPSGTIEITAATELDSSGIIISGKPEDLSKAKIKIAGTKIRLLFYQGNVDWFLGDSYYQMLKESGRFELIDTGIETDDPAKIIAEGKAKGAEAVLILGSEDLKDHVNITQKLFWVSDAKQFSEKKVPVDVAYVKGLRFKSGLFGAREGEVLLSFQLPFGARRLAVGDLDGDDNPEIILAYGTSIRIYRPGVDLKLLWDFKVPSGGDVLWIDTIGLDKNRKDAILMTTIKDGEVSSYIYELKEASFVQIWNAKDIFIRKLDNGLAGQEYTKTDGYDGAVFNLVNADGTYKKGGNIKLPSGVNIYDFQYLNSPDGRQAILSWDDDGYLSLYNEQGIRVWISKEDFGGFSEKFKREAPTISVDRGSWSVKDKLLIKDNEVFAPKRKPLLGMAKGLGYKSSEIKSLWWNGIAIEERQFLEEIGGDIIDYALVGDRIVVLAKPLFGIRTQNILKAENPLGIMVYIFSMKGR